MRHTIALWKEGLSLARLAVQFPETLTEEDAEKMPETIANVRQYEDELSKLVEDEWRAAVRRASDGVCRTITCPFTLKSHLYVIEIGLACSDGG